MFRQHRVYPVWQIHRRSPLIRFIIQRVAGSNIMRHICNVHANLMITIFQLAVRNSIIKIFCIHRVDRERENTTHIFSLAYVFLRNLFR